MKCLIIIKPENKSNPTEIRSNILVLNEVELLYTFAACLNTKCRSCKYKFKLVF